MRKVIILRPSAAGQIFVRLEPGTHILKLKAGHQGECKMKVIVSEEDSAINMKKEVWNVTECGRVSVTQ